MANNGMTRRTITNLKDQQQLRELNRQLDWVWAQLLGGLTEKSFSFGGTTRMVETVQEKIATNLSADHISTRTLQAALADLLVAQIAVANIDWAHITDLNTQIATITDAHIGTAEIGTLETADAHIEAAFVSSLTSPNAHIDRARVALLNVISSQINAADISYAKIKDLTANEAIFQDGVAGELYAKRLAVTNANLLNATISNLILSGTDDKYYAIHIGSNGAIVTEEVTLTAGEINAGQTTGGKQIVTDTVNAASLNGTTVKASQAILDTVLTSALTAGQITASEALIASADIPTLYSTAINAIQDSLLLYASSAIKMFIGSAEDYANTFSFTSTGMRTCFSGSSWSTLIDSNGFYIDHDSVAGHVGAFYQDRLKVDGIQIGDIVAQKTERGGWAWVDA